MIAANSFGSSDNKMISPAYNGDEILSPNPEADATIARYYRENPIPSDLPMPDDMGLSSVNESIVGVDNGGSVLGEETEIHAAEVKGIEDNALAIIKKYTNKTFQPCDFKTTAGYDKTLPTLTEACKLYNLKTITAAEKDRLLSYLNYHYGIMRTCLQNPVVDGDVRIVCSWFGDMLVSIRAATEKTDAELG